MALLIQSKVIKLIFCLAFISSCMANDDNMPSDAKARVWYEAGQSYLAQQKHRRPGGDVKAKNVILFIGDGMSLATVTASRIYQGQLQGNPGEENLLSFEYFPEIALVKTYAVDKQVSDSASTATALLSGVKTRFYTLGTDESNTVENCGKGHLKSLLELAEEHGLATGAVSTARLTHATPAATYAHVSIREFESDAKGCADIAEQLIEFSYGDGLEVALGGGSKMFLPTSDGGLRTDGRNLIEEWKNRFGDDAFVSDTKSLKISNSNHLLGLFSEDHMSFTEHRDKQGFGEPSLTEMTEKAIEIVKQNDKGFFLMIESGRIDHGHHAGIAKLALEETVEFSEAIKRAQELVGPDTLIVVTADHSHTMSFGGYPKRGENILGIAGLDSHGLPYTTLNYANGRGYKEKRDDLSKIDTTADGYLQAAAIPLPIETHGGDDVPVYAIGPGSQWFSGVMEQNVIFHLMKAALLDYRE
ncbi:MAG: alkaline phosphatase [Pseudomonadales bacterium]|nr:alkaline phosphatase [Pseudomonadales bacterium]